MARFLFWSDLQSEFAPFPVPAWQPELRIDGVLVAGDTAVKGAHVDFLVDVCDAWRVPVRAVAGNHESYRAKRYQKHHDQERDRIETLRSRGVDVDVMRGAECVIGDTRVIGATLWTDLMLYPEMSEYIHWSVKDAMNDYRSIRWYCPDTGIYRKMSPGDTVKMHMADRDYIMSRLDVSFNGPTIVMTHHLPVPQMLPEGRFEKRESITSAYASDLWPLIKSRHLDA